MNFLYVEKIAHFLLFLPKKFPHIEILSVLLYHQYVYIIHYKEEFGLNIPEGFANKYAVKTDAKTDMAQIAVSDCFRFSVLTSRLLRIEYEENKNFCDEPTQAVLFRNIGKCPFSFSEKGDCVIIASTDAVFVFDKKKKKLQRVTLNAGKTVTDFESGNLGGTSRTLDMVNGKCKLQKGLMSRNGVSIYDDSKSVIINPDGSIKERQKCLDIYVFAYGNDYRGCLRDFYAICGNVPLVPRYCLGNWWSRYKDYSQEEYVTLMESFIDREIPISVATIDMDWHWVDVKKRFGKESVSYKRKGNLYNRITSLVQQDGWTGYSWNTELFPDYKGFLKYLKEKNFKVTVNIHPSQGVRPFEDMYEEMAQKMGICASDKKQIEFDFADPKFIDAYFDVLHKPYEKNGVDFWWIDWQQEKTTNIKGLDPLWALNHYHTLDIARNGKRPLILSRFAEVGSHRYPLGFSGDTFISWKSLDFQPYFTVNATNIGYTWWSHDIGGHALGRRDDELYARWVQFGQYSPIMRLHSSKDEFMGKEPWKYSYASSLAATTALRERHALIPYIYSMNYRTHKDSIALCEPVYYTYPDVEEAYKIKNEYFFGSELLVAPVTTKADKVTNLAKTTVWLPKGTWYDIYTDYIYEGGQFTDMYRGLESIPVLAKEGAIIPLSQNDKTNDTSNPKELKVRIFYGNNTFNLYEDDGETLNYENGQYAITALKQKATEKNISFVIASAEGDISVLPEKRNWELVFENVTDAKEICVRINARKKNVTYSKKFSKIYLKIENVKPTDEVTVEIQGYEKRVNKSKKALISDVLSKYQLSTVYKMLHFTSFMKDINSPFPLKNEGLKGPIEEILKLK